MKRRAGGYTSMPEVERDWDITGGVPIHVMSYDADTLDETTHSELPAARALVGQRNVTWINIDSTSDAAVLQSLEREFGIHPLTVEDIQNTRQRPKVEEYDGYLYVVAQMVRRAEGELLTEQVSILLGDGWVITVQERKGDVFEGVRGRIRQGRPRIRNGGTDYLLYAIVDAVVDAYFPVLEAIGEAAESVEEDITESTRAEDARVRLQDLKREVLTLRRVAWPQRDAAVALERDEIHWIRPQTRTYLRDVSDHAARVLDVVESERELLASLMDLYLAHVAQRTNDVMRVLTLVATIFIPLTFVVGIYGMNFRYMPELEQHYGYPIVLGGMFVLAVAMFVGFRRKGWA